MKLRVSFLLSVFFCIAFVENKVASIASIIVVVARPVDFTASKNLDNSTHLALTSY